MFRESRVETGGKILFKPFNFLFRLVNFKCLGSVRSKMPGIIYSMTRTVPQAQLIGSKDTDIPVLSERIGAESSKLPVLSVTKE